MSNNQVVIDTLLAKMQQLMVERKAIIAKYDAEIEELEAAVAEYTGQKKVDGKHITLYDDESPDYIKQSPEEM